MASLGPQIKSSPFFHGPLAILQWTRLPGLKINDHQLFSPQAFGTEVAYRCFLDLSADNRSDQGHIPGTWDKGYGFRLMERDVYGKQDWGPGILHWLPSNFNHNEKCCMLQLRLNATKKINKYILKSKQLLLIASHLCFSLTLLERENFLQGKVMTTGKGDFLWCLPSWYLSLCLSKGQRENWVVVVHYAKDK